MDENTTSDTPNDDGFRELALRLLAARFGGEPRLLPGELPHDLPFTLPIPDGARLLGTLVLGDQLPELAGDMTVTLDTALPGEDVIDFYRAQLAGEGWTEAVLPFHHGGFMPAGAERPAMANFDHGELGPSLHISCLNAPNGRTSVQIAVGKEPTVSPQTRRQQRQHMMGPYAMSVMPLLVAPAGSAQVRGGGSSASDEHVDTRATIETDLDVPAVGAHYQAQMKRAGWEQRGVGESGSVAWSAWALKDDEGEPWTAIFAALQRPGTPRRYHLYLDADYEGSRERGPSARLLGSQMHTSYTSYGPMRRGR